MFLDAINKENCQEGWRKLILLPQKKKRKLQGRSLFHRQLNAQRQTRLQFRIPLDAKQSVFLISLCEKSQERGQKPISRKANLGVSIQKLLYREHGAIHVRKSEGIVSC